MYYNENVHSIQNFKINYLENYNDLEVIVKIKNAPFFINFPNINKKWQLFSYWTGPLNVDPCHHLFEKFDVPSPIFVSNSSHPRNGLAFDIIAFSEKPYFFSNQKYTSKK
jgi:hypothetical protein